MLQREATNKIGVNWTNRLLYWYLANKKRSPRLILIMSTNDDIDQENFKLKQSNPSCMLINYPSLNYSK